jgi:hypothetical protein
MDHFIFVSATILSNHVFTNVSSFQIKVEVASYALLVCSGEQLTVIQISPLSHFVF